MGIIKDAIGSALGANDVKNGFNGPQLPFSSRRSANNRSTGDLYNDGRHSPFLTSTQSAGQDWQSRSSDRVHRAYLQPYDGRWERNSTSLSPRRSGYDYEDQIGDDYDRSFADSKDPIPSIDPPSYEASNRRSDGFTTPSPRLSARSSYNNMNQSPGPHPSSRRGFRPLALPQMDPSDGSPFLRAYSYELESYGISESQFIEVVDAINVAIVPNPEMQLFQKGANIAGWFLPGAASIGLMVGQVAVGVGGAFGHVAMVNRVLSKANLDVFIPKGLEICICKAKDIDMEVGQQSFPTQQQIFGTTNPADRLAMYGSLVAPIDKVLPAAQNAGRNDPIALLGRGLGNRNNKKQMEKAREKMAEGKTSKMEAREAGLKWLMVRRATPDATAQWQKTLQQSNGALEQAQNQAHSGQRR